MIKRIQYIIILLFLSLASNSSSQIVTKQKMQADLEFLKDIVCQYYTPLLLFEERTGVSVKDEFKLLASQINKDESMEYFLEMVREGLNIINDPHSRIADSRQIKWFVQNSYLNSIGNITLKDTLKADYYLSCVSDSMFRKIKCQIAMKYINGKYYNLRPFEYHNAIIKTGDIIKKIDGMPIDEFIEKNRLRLFFSCWDPIHKKWFCEYLKVALPLLGKQQFSMKIGDQQVDLDCAKPIKILKKEAQKSSSPMIFQIGNNTLYIRMPAMMQKEWYRNEFLKNYTTSIRKIIIDIRDNSGGDDSVWQDLFQYIIDRPLKYKFYVQIPDEMKNVGTLKDFGDIISLSKGTYVTKNCSIEPNAQSVHFQGDIYILQNRYTYSAAAALSSVAWQNERLKLIGEPTIAIAGYTFPALMFKLPNSGVVVDLAFSVDRTGKNKNKYMDNVKKYVDSVGDVGTYLDQIMNEDTYSKDYLMGKDKLIQYVLKH